MKSSFCPKCGHQAAADATACPGCGHVLNGQALTAPNQAPSSSRPAGVPDGRLPPDLRDWERQHFDPEAFLAGLREVEETGGLELKDFIHELEQGASRE
jgi:hypothetical protein